MTDPIRLEGPPPKVEHPCTCPGPAPFECPVLKMRMGRNAYSMCQNQQGRSDFTTWKAMRLAMANGQEVSRVTTLRPGAVRAPNQAKKDPCGEPCPEPKTVAPSLLRQGFNAVESIAHWNKTGRQTPTVEQYEERRRICQACPDHKLTTVLGMQRCAACGCFIGIKAGLISTPGLSDCPLGHWPAIGELRQAKSSPTAAS